MLEMTQKEVEMVSGGDSIGFPPGSFPALDPVYKLLGSVITGQGSATLNLGVATVTLAGDSVGGTVTASASVPSAGQSLTVTIPVS